MTLAPITPSASALLLMDFQPAILANLSETATLLERAGTALAWAREHQVQVVYVRVAFTDEDYAAIPGRNKAFAAVAQGRFLPAEAPETQIDPSLEARQEDIVVRKVRFGAFSTTDLYASLHAQGVDTLVIGGISTGGVVLSTLRDAADNDYRLLVLADATADPDPDVHRVLIERVFPHQADVIEVDQLAGLTAGA